jgi:orotidine-5'-phosphate decarboxylase
LKLLAVTVLTNFDSHDLRDMGIQRSVQDLVTARALLASEVGCDGVVASGEEPAILRPKIGPRFLIVTPGVRPAGEDVDDHARATTPTQAISAGADYLVKCRQPSMPGANGSSSFAMSGNESRAEGASRLML